MYQQKHCVKSKTEEFKCPIILLEDNNDKYIQQKFSIFPIYLHISSLDQGCEKCSPRVARSLQTLFLLHTAEQFLWLKSS